MLVTRTTGIPLPATPLLTLAVSLASLTKTTSALQARSTWLVKSILRWRWLQAPTLSGMVLLDLCSAPLNPRCQKRLVGTTARDGVTQRPTTQSLQEMISSPKSTDKIRKLAESTKDKKLVAGSTAKEPAARTLKHQSLDSPPVPTSKDVAGGWEHCEGAGCANAEAPIFGQPA